MKKFFFFSVFITFSFLGSTQNFIVEKNETGAFPIVSASAPTSIYVDETDHWLVQKAASLLQADIKKVTGKKSGITNTRPSDKNIIIIGSLDRSSIIQELVKTKKINLTNIKGKWEGYQLQVVNQPLKGIETALVITGSDRRGTAYGVFELSQQIGVSPWYWWADVPVKKKSQLYFKKGLIASGAPAVKYRGIFINDEAPAFSGWTKEKFGGVNHTMYENMFELLLRMKANYLWPAMWGNAFNDDDTLNPIMADKYGIVMGTSHHEPMLRAQQEWKRYGKGKWDYDSNEVVLKEFWRQGIKNMGTHESIVTVGMRGDGDMPMTRGTATALLERIVKDQREIIEEVTGKPASETPQLWALYKEVQDYYDKGMRVPDDVTLLLCDDNWGNIRKLPKLTDPKRKGGYGIYYHFDYVGGPRNYKWVNTNPIARTWEQMHLAYEYNVRDIWIVNVGDLKPMEFPISFFLDYAWNPNKIGADDVQRYTQQWAASQFGNKYAVEIADIISKYTKYNGRRKPELLDATTYSLQNYNEAERVTADYNNLLIKAERINKELPAEYRDAYFQLVLHPVKACANLQELYTNVAWNQFYASKKNILANKYADKAKQLYLKDSLISIEYNNVSGGKWNHMMDQTHIGYTYWQQPPRNKMPDVKYISPDSAMVTNAAYVTNDTSSKTSLHLIPKGTKGNVFYEKDGYVSIEAMHFTNAVNSNGINWKILPDHGRTASAVTPFPVTAATQSLLASTPHLEYDVYLYDIDSAKLALYFSPTLNFHNNPEGLQYAISMDNEMPQVVSLNKEDNNTRTWERWVANSTIVKTSNHYIAKPGKHTIKFWMINPGPVLQKLVVDMGGVKQSYLGPPETIATN